MAKNKDNTLPLEETEKLQFDNNKKMKDNIDVVIEKKKQQQPKLTVIADRTIKTTPVVEPPRTTVNVGIKANKINVST